jgi:hypothetical protein
LDILILSPEDMLLEAIAAQRALMKGYEIPSEPLSLETVRAIDYLFCRELFDELSILTESDRRYQYVQRHGVNEALSRVLPNSLHGDNPRLFQSSIRTQREADEFLFNAGSLWLAERALTQFRAGFLSGRIDPHREVQGAKILVLSRNDHTLYQEQIGHAGVGWLSDRAFLGNRGREAELERKHSAMLPQMIERVLAASEDDWELHPEADAHFHDCAEVYLARMPYRDLLSPDDRIGGRPYSDYVEVLTALSAMNEMRLFTADVLNSRRPHLGMRNVLTGGSLMQELVEGVSNFLDGDTSEVGGLLGHLTLTPFNRTAHLSRGTPTWAPIIRTSVNFCILPCFGLEMNPFLFLATELRERYKSDWFEAANAREGRWVAELRRLFPGSRWRCADGIKIRRGGKVMTDIDFVAYDSDSKRAALFQLKWQQPSASDERTRRNNASNLLSESNKWVATVHDWLANEGLAALGKRLDIGEGELIGASLFVLGRYGAHFSGNSNPDPRAAWSGWGHMERERALHPDATVDAMHGNIHEAMANATTSVQPESFLLPLPGLTMVLNPTREPLDP